jgi:hypothetical protein
MLIATLGGADDGVKSLTAARTTVPPRIDGQLGEACWQRADVATDFCVIGDAKTQAAHQTVGRIVYDDANLYIGVKCAEPRMDLLRRVTAASDGDFHYHEGETIEIFLDVNHDRRTFLQIMVNTNGSWQTHALDTMQLRHMYIEPAVHLHDDGFSMEVRVPLSILHLQPGSPGTRGLNLCRARMIQGKPGEDLPPKDVYSAWQFPGSSACASGRATPPPKRS